MTSMIKRIFDVVAALFGLVVLAPMLVLIAITIYLQMGQPILFTQPRPGQHSKVFTFYKFRTMSDAYDQASNLLPDADRLTPIGKFLRKTSLDELPQLFNILKGDMSFVGPRPLLVEYLDYYTPEHARRHAVKPGITGWAQVHGRNTISWMEKCDLDVWYVDHQSLWLDLKILAMTVGKVLGQKDVSLSECPEASKQQIEAIK
ncbi:MAG TPA: sugar transferase, partial [Allocoleopsis sp.]